MLRYAVREEYRRIPAAEYLARFVDVPRFLAFCRVCPVYDRNWACPEFYFDPVAVWARYRWLHLMAFWMEFEPSQPRAGFDHDRLVAEVMAMFHREKRGAHQRLMLLRTAVPESYPLGSGSCELCLDCTRTQNLPCRFPDQLVHSIEALGGDVEATMRDLFDQPMQWSDGTNLPDSFLLAVGLLCDLEELPLRQDSCGIPSSENMDAA